MSELSETLCFCGFLNAERTASVNSSQLREIHRQLNRGCLFKKRKTPGHVSRALYVVCWNAR
jgi:hypothetical protein